MSFQTANALNRRNFNLLLSDQGSVPELVTLLHFDGANGSSVFTDNGPFNRAAVLSGTPTISTAQGVFAQSGIFSGIGQEVQFNIPEGQGLTPQFTIEGRVRLDRLTANFFFASQKPTLVTASTIWLEVGGNTANRISAYIAGSYLTALANAVINQWYAIAIVQDATSKRLYIDGVLQESSPTNLFTQSAGIDRMTYGGSGGLSSVLNYHQGFLDEWRVSRAALYTGPSYTVAGAPFPPP